MNEVHHPSGSIKSKKPFPDPAEPRCLHIVLDCSSTTNEIHHSVRVPNCSKPDYPSTACALGYFSSD